MSDTPVTPTLQETEARKIINARYLYLHIQFWARHITCKERRERGGRRKKKTAREREEKRRGEARMWVITFESKIMVKK